MAAVLREAEYLEERGECLVLAFAMMYVSCRVYIFIMNFTVV